jgi:hypothetical protein
MELLIAGPVFVGLARCDEQYRLLEASRKIRLRRQAFLAVLVWPSNRDEQQIADSRYQAV